MSYFRKLEEIIRGRLEVARTSSSSDWDKPLPTSRLSCFFLIFYVLDVSLPRGLPHFLAFWEPREMHGNIDRNVLWYCVDLFSKSPQERKCSSHTSLNSTFPQASRFRGVPAMSIQANVFIVWKTKGNHFEDNCRADMQNQLHLSIFHSNTQSAQLMNRRRFVTPDVSKFFQNISPRHTT